MKRNIILILMLMIFKIETLHPDIIPSGEENSASLAGELSREILKNPSGDLVPFYISKLMGLAPAVGRSKISAVFEEAAVKLQANGEKANIALPILRLSTDELKNNYSESIKNFSAVKKWNISGPWKKYGKADYDFEFNPETVFKIEDIEKGRNLSTEENGILFPYKFKHKAGETFYATYSFTSENSIVFWILSDAEYKLIINGREVAVNRNIGSSLKAFYLKGSAGYTVRIKMQSRDAGDHPYIRGLMTDEKYHPVNTFSTNAIFNSNFIAEKIFSSDESGESIPREAELLTGRMRELIQSGEFFRGYKLGVSVTKKFPSYFAAYKELIPLLDSMNRDDEFFAYIKQFQTLFPDSDIHRMWLAEFYMTRNPGKFIEIMKNLPLYKTSLKTVETYINILCGQKKYTEALAICMELRSDPLFRNKIPEIIKAAGNIDLWRKTLIEDAASTNEADAYYALGLAEMRTGLDPVMYWRKGFSLDEDPGMMRDLSDLYENGVLEMNDFYSGIYTDLHPEFRWKAKRRKISVNIFESGRVLIVGEDIIPSGKLIKNEKFAEGGTGFSSGEIKTSIPYINGLKILYVLKARDGLPETVAFNTSVAGEKQFIVNYKIQGDEEFSVVKYSGEYMRNESDPFTMVKELILKAKNENISELDYEVIFHGDFKYPVSYNGEFLTAGRYSDGIIRSWTNERFSRGDTEAAVSEISKFSSEKVFSQWYNKVVIYATESAGTKNLRESGKEDLEKVIKGVHFYIMSSITKRGSVNFNPDKVSSVLKNGEGTVEERTLAGKVLLESNGIQSSISFAKNKSGLINKILLYVPGNGDKGYWLDFYGEGLLDKTESGFDAIVITGEGFKTFPVNPETYIR